MITLTRLNGQPFAVNSDLIERIDSTPDTVLTLVDGTKYLVTESLEQVVDAVRQFRASIVASAESMAVQEHVPNLRVLSPRKEG